MRRGKRKYGAFSTRFGGVARRSATSPSERLCAPGLPQPGRRVGDRGTFSPIRKETTRKGEREGRPPPSRPLTKYSDSSTEYWRLYLGLKAFMTGREGGVPVPELSGQRADSET